jgi:hypothetical protein
MGSVERFGQAAQAYADRVIGDAEVRETGAHPSALGLIAMAIVAITDVGYLAIIVAQGGPSDVARVAFVATAIAAVAACAGIGATRARPIDRLPWLGAATGTLLVLGYLGLFSIGLPLFVAGVLTAIGWITTSGSAGPGRRARVLAVVLAFAGPAIVIGGMWVT